MRGKMYQLPSNTQTQAGIASPPKTYPELLDAAAKLKAKGITPFVVGGVHDALSPTVAGILATDLYKKNPNWVHDRRDGKVKFCDPEFKSGAAKLAELVAKGYIDKGDDGSAVVPAFTGGGLLVSATAKNLDAAKKFALGFQLDKSYQDSSAKADGDREWRRWTSGAPTTPTASVHSF